MGNQAGLWAVLSTVVGLAAAGVYYWLLYGALDRMTGGRGVGPRPEAVSVPSKVWHIPPPPLNPNASVWQPWFMYPGPLWLELKFGLATVRGMWKGHIHEVAAYRYYVGDQLQEAIDAAEQALQYGVRPSCAAARVRGLAVAEIEASAAARRVTSGPFTLELPADTALYAGLADVAITCRQRARALLGFEPRQTTVTLLPPGSLPMGAESHWGYVIPKHGYDRICLIRSSPDSMDALAAGLVVEYTQLALLRTSAGNAPWWLAEGLSARLARDMGFEAQIDDSTHIDREPDGLSERVSNRAAGRSPITIVVGTPALALDVVNGLASVYGEAAVGEFARQLASKPEAKAFRTAFGISMQRFASQWRRS